jgi:MFS family permease
MSTIGTPVLSCQEAGPSVYNRVFWFQYLANASLVTANALTFRFAELVNHLGGSEKIAGTIVGVGVIGALAARFVLGQAIDRYGTRRLWIISSLLFISGCSMFLASGRLSWELYAARIAFAIGLAGMFTCSIVHIQNQVPSYRRTEVIGSLGSSGFVGMIAGSQLGDWIFNAFANGHTQFLVLFGTAALLGVIYLAIVVTLTWRDGHQQPKEAPAAHRLIFRYWPGAVVLVAIMMGVGFAVTTVFLTRFATHLDLKRGIGTFFTGYALAAFTFRIGGRDWSRTIGRHRMILIGLAGHTIGNLMFPLVTREWHFLFPAALCGLGHALLFPAVVSLGAGSFPREYRGTGTTIVLGFTEVGAMLSAPVLGWIIEYFGALYGNAAGFHAMFYTAAAFACGTGVFYALTAARKPDSDLIRDPARHDPLSEVRTANEPFAPTPEPAPFAAEEPEAVPFPHLGRSA